ncbi:MAG: LPS export ABC transporter permease LptG [Pseudomonadota bacterium]
MTRALSLPRMRRLQMSTTLTWYIARQFAIFWGSFFSAIAAIILLVSLVDLLDRFGGREGVTLGVVFEMSLLKLPHLSLEVMPFTLLFAGLATFWRLTRTHELVVARAAGVSVWQFLLPVLLVAVAMGGITVTVFNPIAATLLSRFELVEARFSRSGPRSALAVSRTGLWLRQADQQGQAVIHAARLDPDGITLQNVIVFRFDTGDRFLERIDAERAQLGDGQWNLTDAWVSGPERVPGFVEETEIATTLTPAKIQESFADPETISFWSLPGFIRLLEESGFSSVRHKLQWNRLLATPLLYAAMVLLAATFSLRPQRRGKVGIVILSGMLAGFLLYFFSNFVIALGLSSKIPVVLAGWAPAGASMMLGIAMLLHLEDG